MRPAPWVHAGVPTRSRKGSPTGFATLEKCEIAETDPNGMGGARSLCQSRIVDGSQIPPKLEAEVQGLREEAQKHCGGLLAPVQ